MLYIVKFIPTKHEVPESIPAPVVRFFSSWEVFQGIIGLVIHDLFPCTIFGLGQGRPTNCLLNIYGPE